MTNSDILVLSMPAIAGAAVALTGAIVVFWATRRPKRSILTIVEGNPPTDRNVRDKLFGAGRYGEATVEVEEEIVPDTTKADIENLRAAQAALIQRLERLQRAADDLKRDEAKRAAPPLGWPQPQ